MHNGGNSFPSIKIDQNTQGWGWAGLAIVHTIFWSIGAAEEVCEEPAMKLEKTTSWEESLRLVIKKPDVIFAGVVRRPVTTALRMRNLDQKELWEMLHPLGDMLRISRKMDNSWVTSIIKSHK